MPDNRIRIDLMPPENFLDIPQHLVVKPIHIFPNYFVSNCGRVLSKRKHTGYKYLTNSLDNKGYLRVKICQRGDKKNVPVHTLVARAFCEGYREGLQVNHKDTCKTNNHYSNLEWVTSLDNIRHARAAGLYPRKYKKKRGDE